MHHGHLHEYAESHGDAGARREGERRTLVVVGLTALMMVAELVVGRWSGSMALFADGVHMATDVAALGLAAVAYYYARTRAGNEAHSFGTGKVYALGGYTSAIVLIGTAVWMAIDSIERLLSPVAISFDEALPVAVVGLVVNLVSAKLLDHSSFSHAGHGNAHGHGHGHDHDTQHPVAHDPAGHVPASHDHDGHGGDRASRPVEDHNLRAAYLHAVADALTSVLAIAALLAARYLGLTFLDPVMGLVGAALIVVWGVRLSRSAAKQLLDIAPSLDDTRTIRRELEAVDDVCVADLHVWELGPGERSCIVKLVTSSPRDPSFYRDLIKSKVKLSHLTVEVQRCTAHHEVPSC